MGGSDLCFDIFLDSNSSSTINFKVNSGDKLSLITGQEKSTVSYIHGICQSAERNIANKFLSILNCILNTDKRRKQTSSGK